MIAVSNETYEDKFILFFRYAKTDLNTIILICHGLNFWYRQLKRFNSFENDPGHLNTCKQKFQEQILGLFFENFILYFIIDYEKCQIAKKTFNLSSQNHITNFVQIIPGLLNIRESAEKFIG